MLRDTVKKLIPENKRIVINLSGTNYIDSGGLGTLVSLYTSAQTAGSSIKLANLTQRVGDLLQVTKAADRLRSVRERERGGGRVPQGRGCVAFRVLHIFCGSEAGK